LGAGKLVEHRRGEERGAHEAAGQALGGAADGGDIDRGHSAFIRHRSVHVITAIAWIGSSFYFIHLDLSLKRPEGLPAGVGGEAWQVHGGGFYRMQKYVIA